MHETDIVPRSILLDRNDDIPVKSSGEQESQALVQQKGEVCLAATSPE